MNVALLLFGLALASGYWAGGYDPPETWPYVVTAVLVAACGLAICFAVADLTT